MCSHHGQQVWACSARAARSSVAACKPPHDACFCSSCCTAISELLFSSCKLSRLLGGQLTVGGSTAAQLLQMQAYRQHTASIPACPPLACTAISELSSAAVNCPLFASANLQNRLSTSSTSACTTASSTCVCWLYLAWLAWLAMGACLQRSESCGDRCSRSWRKGAQRQRSPPAEHMPLVSPMHGLDTQPRQQRSMVGPSLNR